MITYREREKINENSSAALCNVATWKSESVCVSKILWYVSWWADLIYDAHCIAKGFTSLKASLTRQFSFNKNRKIVWFFHLTHQPWTITQQFTKARRWFKSINSYCICNYVNMLAYTKSEYWIYWIRWRFKIEPII